ncbi:hypothetical protein Peetri_00089 [Pseudomonas phage vB_PpuM-Peetri]
MKDLQEHFAENFERTDLTGAIHWAQKWYKEMEQVLPGEDKAQFTCRSMAGHISDYLEGYTGAEIESFNQGAWHDNATYMDTKYGSTVYSFMFGGDYPSVEKS